MGGDFVTTHPFFRLRSPGHPWFSVGKQGWALALFCFSVTITKNKDSLTVWRLHGYPTFCTFSYSRLFQDDLLHPVISISSC